MSMTRPDSADPRAARATVTPAAVRDAALTLFAERGYHGTALSQIAAALGVRTPSLYNHMSSKHDLLDAIVTDTTEQVWADYEAAVRDSTGPADALHRAVQAYALRHAQHRREALIVSRDIASLEPAAHERVLRLRRRHEHAIRSLIEDGVRESVFHVDTPSLASFAILEMCVSIARWFREDGAVSAQEVAAQYGTYALRLAGHHGPETS
ncbi:TetR/AcrR family transcriptional regulator [Streptomyces sp. NPDC059262]|uniref:TetR/AcrR family transcriptional regulator n=1 Tax=Streptomyces sp. NPDC059262 TaxID=3346797 RepID=UPI0036A0AA65